MLYIIGLGLHDQKDVSVKGLEAIQQCESIYLEYYTSTLQCSIEELEKFYNKPIIKAERPLVESQAEETILKDAQTKNTAFLVIGDVFSATTHMDIYLRAKEKNIPVEVIHGASVLTAVGMTGLELYKFGKTTSIPFHNENVKSPVQVLEQNQSSNLHTLFLLDLDPPNQKYMQISEAISFLEREGVDLNQLAVGCAGLGSSNQQIKSGLLKDLKEFNFTEVPQCLIIPAKQMHFVEEEMVKSWE